MQRILQKTTLILTLLCAVSFVGVGYGRFVIPDTVQTLSDTDRYLPPLYSDAGQNVRFLRTVPVKQKNVQTTPRVYAKPLGSAFGIKLYTDGVMIVRTDTVPGESGTVSPADQAGVRAGDRILSVNGQAVHSNAQTANLLSQSGGSSVTLRIQRETVIFETTLTPVLSKTDGKYRVGLWVRDSSAGIGTMTFFIPQYSLFAGLGHAVCDVDTGQILPLANGEAVAVEIKGSYKGRSGTPGELCGVFTTTPIGRLLANTDTGVYGTVQSIPSTQDVLPVAMYYEVKTGSAEILAQVDENGPRAYTVQITKLFSNPDAHQKNLIVKVTDPDLIEKTGGIVQGMSGSPIVQDGMLVGAVTHVFLNDPLQGFGVYAQTMLNEMQALAAQQDAA